MNVGVATTAPQSTTQTSNQSSTGNSNRSAFFDMLSAASNNSEIAVEPLTMASLNHMATGTEEGKSNDVFSMLLNALQGDSVDGEQGIPNTELKDSDQLSKQIILDLLNLLPDYLRSDVEELLKSGDYMNLQDGSLTLAQMLAMFISLASQRPGDRDATLQNSQDNLRAQLQQALKTESQATGLNSSEILNKVDKLMNTTTSQPKQDYLQGLLQRMSLTGNRSTEQTGLNVSSITDPSQNMSRAQQLVIHIGEQPTKEAEQRQFVRQFQDILGRGLLKQLNNGTSQLTIKLHPQHLGRLDIQLVQMQGVITAKITASTAAARDLIEGQLQQLRNAFGQQQLNVERIEIHQQQSNNQQLNKDGQNKQQQEQSSNEDSNQEEQAPNVNSFEELLEELSINEKV